MLKGKIQVTDAREPMSEHRTQRKELGTKKQGNRFLALCCFFPLVSFLFLIPCFAQDPWEGVRWQSEKGVVSYALLKDSIVKMRVGSLMGPVYRTLVNLEERKAGSNEELWNGKNESGVIDFKDYGEFHFCVDSLPKPKKDLVLAVDISFIPEQISNFSKEVLQNEVKQGKLFLTGKLPALILDINHEDYSWFCQQGIEIMVFWDNRLMKLERAKGFPYTINLDGQPLLNGKHLLTFNVWSEDHSSVAYRSLLVSERSGLKDSSREKVKETTQKLSGSLLYCRRDRGFWQIWVSGLDGSKSRPLTKSPVDKRYPCFSPDGKKIAYVTNQGELWIMDKHGKNNQKLSLPIHASCPCWSPNSKSIVFVSYLDLYHGDSEIFAVKLDTLELKKLTSRPWLQYDPYYSDDGTVLVFTDGPELYAQEIRKLDLLTGDVIQLTDNKAYDYDREPVYSPDNQEIIYSSNEKGNYDIWVMDKFGRDKRNLTSHPAYDCSPNITKDGRWIYFLSDRTGIQEIWRMDKDGSNLVQITAAGVDIQDLRVWTSLSTDKKVHP